MWAGALDVAVELGVEEGVAVAVEVPVAVGVLVGVPVSVGVPVKVGEPVSVGVEEFVGEGLIVGVAVAGLQTISGLNEFWGVPGAINIKSKILLFKS